MRCMSLVKVRAVHLWVPVVEGVSLCVPDCTVWELRFVCFLACVGLKEGRNQVTDDGGLTVYREYTKHVTYVHLVLRS